MKMTHPRCTSAAALAAFLLFASGIAAAQTARTIISGDGRQIEVRDTSRIVTIGSAITEIVFALGRGKDVVAVDQTSTFPP
jgi:iron complex transport system substrate-binding protein